MLSSVLSQCSLYIHTRLFSQLCFYWQHSALWEGVYEYTRPRGQHVICDPPQKQWQSSLTGLNVNLNPIIPHLQQYKDCKEMTEIFIIIFISQSSQLGALFVITIPNLILLLLPWLIILDEVESHKIHLLHNRNKIMHELKGFLNWSLSLLWVVDIRAHSHEPQSQLDTELSCFTRAWLSPFTFIVNTGCNAWTMRSLQHTSIGKDVQCCEDCVLILYEDTPWRSTMMALYEDPL